MIEQIKNINPKEITASAEVQNLLILFMNIVENQAQEINELRQENQAFRDEINRLKGEHGDLPPKPPKTPGSAKGVKEGKKKNKKDRKKAALLLVLDFPFLPLHNNTAELAVRREVQKRDISLHTMSVKGTRAQDAFMSVVETAAKLGVNALDYLYDRITGKYKMISLTDLITNTL